MRVLLLVGLSPALGGFGNWISGLFPGRFMGAGGKGMSVADDNEAVLVFGSTGKSGREVVDAVLASGRKVVGTARSAAKAKDALGEAVMGNPRFRLEEGCDVTSALAPSIFDGCSQVVIATGPVFGEQKMTSEAVDYFGTMSIIKAAEQAGLKHAPGVQATEKVLSRWGSSSSGGDDDSEPAVQDNAASWARLDDVIMGGQSESGWAKNDELDFGRWQGIMRVEGGGFCGTVVNRMDVDAAGFDGIRLRVRGDGNRYKFRLKPTGQLAANEYQYQAAFDTTPMTGGDGWQTLDLPFENFIAVRRNTVLYDAPRVNSAGGKISSIGLVFSRFEFNELPNPNCTPGGFQLDVKEISLYRSTRPSVVMISSAAAERYNRLTKEQRLQDIPIVQLNPQGILSHKYKAESFLRASQLPYHIIRSTGLLPVVKAGQPDHAKRKLQVGQGDDISGRLSRSELGSAVAAALRSPYTSGTTIELRRDESEDGLTDSPIDFTLLFKGLVKDTNRVVAGMRPFPVAKDAPLPVTEEEKQRILNDPRVQERTQRGKVARGET